jgi:hypothetical protein
MCVKVPTFTSFLELFANLIVSQKRLIPSSKQALLDLQKLLHQHKIYTESEKRRKLLRIKYVFTLT